VSDAGGARRKGADGQNRPYGIYQLVVTETDLNPGESILQRPENVRGDPDPGAIPSVLDFADLVQALDRVEPANGQPNRGFYVVGPELLRLGEEVMPTYRTQRLKYEGSELPNRPTLLLRRLACPHLPPNPRVLPNGLIGWDISLPHNPYVTVDYLEHVRLNDAQAERHGSEGRMQPYAAALS